MFSLHTRQQSRSPSRGFSLQPLEFPGSNVAHGMPRQGGEVLVFCEIVNNTELKLIWSFSNQIETRTAISQEI